MDEYDPKAFENFEGAIVPLVIYENGERKVIGKAKLATSDEQGLMVEGKIDDKYKGILDTSPISFKAAE